MKFSRSHPINIIEHTSKYLVLLVFPLIRALILTKYDIYTWLRGAWFDIITLLLIIALGFIAWYKYVYAVTKDGIYIRKGIMIFRSRFIPFDKLTVISIEKPFYLLPFRAVRISADTDGGSARTPDFEITVNRSKVEPFLKYSSRKIVEKKSIKRVYRPKNFYIAVLSFITSNSLAGVIFFSTFVSGAGKVLGSDVEQLILSRLTTLTLKIAKGIPPAAAILAAIIAGGWLLSFLVNLIRHLRFSVVRQSGALTINSGIITVREHLLTVKRINFIEIRQSLMTKLFGFYAVFIHSNGYGKHKNELSVLMPAGEKHELRRTLDVLLPEIPMEKNKLRPKIRYLSRFLIPPLTWIICVSVFWGVASWNVDFFGTAVFYFGLMAEIPCFWYLFVKIASFFHTGIGVTEKGYTFRYTYGYRIKTVAVPKKRVVKLTVRQSFWQIMSGCCDLVILTYSEGMKRHVVPNLKLEEVKKLLEIENCYPEKKKGDL